MEENNPLSSESPAPAPAEKKPFELTMPMAVVLAAVIIGISLIVVKMPSRSQTGGSQGAPTTESMIADVLSTKGKLSIASVSTADHIRGSSTPKVTIVEYSDLECPFCKVFHGTMQRIIAQYGDNVAWVYRHYPLDCVDNADPSCSPLHPKARAEAIAAECAATQGGNDAFWKYADEIFAITPSNNGLDPAELTKTAQKLGLNMTAFNTCLSTKATASIVSAEAQDGFKNAGVQGTPTSVIIDNKTGTTYLLGGAYPYDVVKGLLDKLLK